MAEINLDNPEAEPVLTRVAVTGALTAVLDVLVAFGVHLTSAQTSAILGLVNVGALGILAWRLRGKVFSPATVAADYQRR